MSAFDFARLKARDVRATHVDLRARGPDAVAAAAKAAGGFVIKKVPVGDAVLGTSDAKLLRDWLSIYVRDDLSDAESAAHVAHELGHLYLHRPEDGCDGADPDHGASRAVARVESYGPRERRELQANVFAREFLLPRALARQLFLAERRSGTEIAKDLDLPPSLVRQQLLDSLLAPDASPPKLETASRPSDRDDSQYTAAEYAGRALLVEAGPGAGKTRTLVMRIGHLLSNEGAQPREILALTFSNKAAGELSERVSKDRPDAAAEMWIGTFHAFGLELIRRYYDRLGLPANVQLIDRAQAIELLEDRLPILGLDHFHDLRNPDQQLAIILTAISRAKDELVEAPEFERRAQAARNVAKSPDDVKAAERACEAARVYTIYSETLLAKGAVDFGDLVMLPTLLLQHDPEVLAQVAARHPRILVDEYQDVNRASARLLIELYQQGAQLWVVGDARQSLYRWRGASSANMAGFEQDFKEGKRLPLDRNYRSTDHIVGLCRQFAKNMEAGKHGLAYTATAKRTERGSLTQLKVGRNDDCEGELLVAEILRLRDAGVRLFDQVVLSPTNSRLDIMAAALARSGIATTHLGNFFEREEVRDVLSVLALLAEANGGALVRVAALRSVAVGARDIAVIVRSAQTARVPLISILSKARQVEGISPVGAESLERLSSQLSGLDSQTAA